MYKEIIRQRSLNGYGFLARRLWLTRATQRTLELAFQDNSDDEYIVRRPRLIRERADHFSELDDIEFITKYRLSKRTHLYVLKLIESKLYFLLTS